MYANQGAGQDCGMFAHQQPVVRLMGWNKGIYALRTLPDSGYEATLVEADAYWCLSFYFTPEVKDTLMKLQKHTARITHSADAD